MNDTKVLFVTKDLAAQRIASLIRGSLAKRSIVTAIASEGLSTDAWQRSGFTPDFILSKTGETEGATEVAGVLEAFQPSMVVVGISSPINIELRFLAEANRRGIRTVALEDFHGGHRRLRSNAPHALVVQDRYAEQLARDSYGQAVQVIRGGTSAIWQGEVDGELKKQIQNIRLTCAGGSGCTIALFVSGSTLDDLALAIASVKMTKNCALIPRFHPKVAKSICPRTHVSFEQTWRAMLDESGVAHEFVGLGVKDETDQLASLADVTLSGFSLVLNVAAKFGKVAGSLRTAETLASLKEQVGLTDVPLVMMGMAHPITAPVDLSTLAPLGGDNLRSFDPEYVVQQLFP